MEMSSGASDVVAHKYLFYNELAIFRVGKTTTLKIAYYLIANDLRATPNVNARGLERTYFVTSTFLWERRLFSARKPITWLSMEASMCW